MLQVTELDHLVLVCADVERSLAWYQQRLGLEGMRIDAWRNGEVFFPSVRINEGTIIDLIAGRVEGGGERLGRNVEHFCVVVEPTDLAAVVASGDFDVLEGPVARFGARGMATSIYVRDRDGNTVEIRHY
jgi:catechol 2,3-dioxygenase-like lactoylglutathione lyase family enzyme